MALQFVAVPQVNGQPVKATAEERASTLSLAART